MKSWQYAIAVNTADKRKKKRNVGKKKKRSLKQRNLLHYTCILYARNTLFLIVAFFMIRVISEGERERERERKKKEKKNTKKEQRNGVVDSWLRFYDSLFTILLRTPGDLVHESRSFRNLQSRV